MRTRSLRRRELISRQIAPAMRAVDQSDLGHDRNLSAGREREDADSGEVWEGLRPLKKRLMVSACQVHVARTSCRVWSPRHRSGMDAVLARRCLVVWVGWTGAACSPRLDDVVPRQSCVGVWSGARCGRLGEALDHRSVHFRPCGFTVRETVRVQNGYTRTAHQGVRVCEGRARTTRSQVRTHFPPPTVRGIGRILGQRATFARQALDLRGSSPLRGWFAASAGGPRWPARHRSHADPSTDR